MLWAVVLTVANPAMTRRSVQPRPRIPSGGGAMLKKLLILGLVVGAVALASIPWWTTRMAEQALANPTDPMAAERLQRAIQIKIFILNHQEAGDLAQQGVIFFPESAHLPSFLLVAAQAAEKNGNPIGAIHWYRRFLEIYPEHEWATQAQNYLKQHQEPTRGE